MKLCSLIVYFTVIGDIEYLKYNDIYPPGIMSYKIYYITDVYYVIEN
jgi:hypothetical protein